MSLPDDLDEDFPRFGCLGLAASAVAAMVVVVLVVAVAVVLWRVL